MKKFFLLLALMLMVTGCALSEKRPEDPIELLLGVETEVTIGENETIWFRFVPEETTEYTFQFESSMLSLALYEENIGYLDWYSSVGMGYHCQMVVGHTYYLYVKNYSSGKTVKFSLEKYQGLLYAKRDNDDYSAIYVDLDEQAVLHVNAAVNAGSTHYTWYVDGNLIEHATEATYITDEIVYIASYYCIVSDDFGHSESVYFTVCVDNKLTIQGERSQNITTKPGDYITLSFSATVKMGKITYQWYDAYSDSFIEGVTSSTYVTDPLLQNSFFRCEVTDRFGNREYVYFYITLDNELQAEAGNNGKYLITPGDTATLEVIASVSQGNITYAWYRAGEQIEGAQDASYVTNEI